MNRKDMSEMIEEMEKMDYPPCLYVKGGKVIRTKVDSEGSYVFT